MLNVFTKIGAASSNVLLVIAQLVPLLTELKAQHGQPMSADEQTGISGVAMSVFSTIEGISGKTLASDPEIQKAIQDAVSAFADVDALIRKKHLATVTPAA